MRRAFLEPDWNASDSRRSNAVAFGLPLDDSVAYLSDMFNRRVLGNLGVRCAKIADGEPVHVVVAGEPGEGLEFFCGDAEEVGQALGGLFDFESAAQFGILGGDADGATARIADAVLLTSGRHEGSAGDGDGIGTQGEGFGEVGGDPHSAGYHE